MPYISCINSCCLLLFLGWYDKPCCRQDDATGLFPVLTVGHSRKYHNTLCLSPQILHKHCFQFLLRITMVPRENKMLMQNLGQKQRVLWYFPKWPITIVISQRKQKSILNYVVVLCEETYLNFKVAKSMLISKTKWRS